MPSGYLPGLNRTWYRVGAILMILLGVVLSILTFTGVIGGGTVMGILWIVVAVAGAVGLADAMRNG